MGDVSILILAAGQSSRMRGADKLLQEIDGVAVLRRQVLAALGTGAAVYVALAPDRPARGTVLQDLEFGRVEVAQARDGMGASIRAGVSGLADNCTGVAIVPADMPELTTQDLRLVLDKFRAAPDQVCRATSEAGVAGHPVVFPARLFAALARLSGDNGARAVLQGETPRLTALPGDHAVTDLDTPEDWAAWHAARKPRR